MWFEAVFGLRINLEKSELIPVGRVESMDDLAGEFGCSLGSLPTTYLGMPLGAPLSQSQFGMVWKSAFEEGYLCGRDNIYPREEGRLSFVVHYRIYPSI